MEHAEKNQWSIKKGSGTPVTVSDQIRWNPPIFNKKTLKL